MAVNVRHPMWLRRLSDPCAETFATLYAIEALTRSILTTIIPLQALEVMGTSQKVSQLYFWVGLSGLCFGLLVPALVRLLARRYVVSIAAGLLLAACAAIAFGEFWGQTIGMAARVMGTVAMTICFNLYVMDHLPREELGRSEPLRLFYAGAVWTAGPFIGVYLKAHVGIWLPCAISALGVLTHIGYFWYLRLSDNPAIKPGKTEVVSPIANIRHFIEQPRLIMAWLLAGGRSAWWAMFFIYTPIFAVQSGLGEVVGGILVSIGAGYSFLLPLFGRLTRRYGLRRVLVLAALGSAAFNGLVAVFFGLPWLAAGFLILAAMMAAFMDAAGYLPFMLAVRPRERAAMTSVYLTHRDFAEIGPPGLYALLLKVFPLQAVFVTNAAIMLLVAALANRLHPRFGQSVERRNGVLVAEEDPS